MIPFNFPQKVLDDIARLQRDLAKAETSMELMKERIEYLEASVRHLEDGTTP